MNNLIILPGFWKATKERVKGSLDFRKAVRDVLVALRVKFYDDCCPASSDPNFPVTRYNMTGTQWERYDAATKTWVVVVDDVV